MRLSLLNQPPEIRLRRLRGQLPGAAELCLAKCAGERPILLQPSQYVVKSIARYHLYQFGVFRDAICACGFAPHSYFDLLIESHVNDKQQQLRHDQNAAMATLTCWRDDLQCMRIVLEGEEPIATDKSEAERSSIAFDTS